VLAFSLKMLTAWTGADLSTGLGGAKVEMFGSDTPLLTFANE